MTPKCVMSNRPTHLPVTAHPLRRPGVLLLTAGSAFSLNALALAQIEGAAVMRGQASIQQQGSHTVINASHNSIIHYSRFDIPAQSSVQFVQPSSDSRVLNRISGASPTRIDGALLANGHVYLVNPAGVVFGNNAVINASRFVAAAGRMSDRDFLEGRDRFSRLTGSVLNEGAIEASSVHLIGRHVENHGSIIARGGVVTMLSGSDVLVREQGSRVSVRVDGQALDPSQRSSADSVASRSAGAASLKRSLKSLGAGDVVSLAVKNTGRIDVGSGSATLGTSGGIVRNEGLVSASVESGTAGSVALQGARVEHFGAVVATSADGTSGEVNVTSVSGTMLGNDSLIDVSGGEGASNAGTVLVHAYQGSTIFAPDATIDISGGKLGGDGGFAEVSAKENLAFLGTIRGDVQEGFARAQALLDPLDVYIGASGTNNSAVDGLISALDDPTQNYYISTSAIEAFPGDMRIEALQDIWIGRNINKVNGGLTLSAERDIVFSSFPSAASGWCPVPQLTNLEVRADFLTFTAGRNIRDHVLCGTRLVSTRGDIRLTALTGRAEFGSVRVAPWQNLSITQALSRSVGAQPGGYIENGAQTNLFVTVTEGSIIFEDPRGTRSQTLNNVTATARDDIIFNDALNVCVDGSFRAGENIIFNASVVSDNSLRFNSGLNGNGGDIFFCVPNLVVGSRTIELIAGGPGIAGDARVDARTFSPSFRGSMGQAGTSPSVFTIAQNPTLTSDALPLASQFGAGLSCDVLYTVQSFAGDVIISDASTVNGANLVLASASALDPSSTARVFIDDELNLCRLLVNGNSSISRHVTTLHEQTYNGPVIVRQDSNLTGTQVIFRSTVDASEPCGAGLNIFADAFFEDNVGLNAPLNFLAVSGHSTLGTPTLSHITIATCNNQYYDQGLTLVTDATLRSEQGTVYIRGLVDGVTDCEQSLVIDADALLTRSVGTLHPLESLLITRSATLGEAGADPISIITCGDQTYLGPVLLSNDVTMFTDGGLVRFASTVDAEDECSQSLTVNSDAAFEGNVGSLAPLQALTVNGSTTLGRVDGDAISVVTCSDQMYNGSVTLANDASLRSIDGNVLVSGTIDGTSDCEQSLTVDAELAAFQRSIGQIAALESLTVTASVLLGSESLGTILVTTCHDQTYNGPTTLASSAVLTSLQGGTVRFNGTLNGTTPCEQDLLVRANAAFENDVGSLVELDSLTVTGGTTLGRGSDDTIHVFTCGDQHYQGNTTLASSAELFSTAGAVRFDGLVDAAESCAQSLHVHSDAVFAGSVGSLLPLLWVSVDGATELGSSAGGAMSVTTCEHQSYAGPVTLASDATLTSLGEALVSFGSTIDGATDCGQSLAVRAPSAFRGNVGATHALRSLELVGPATLGSSAAPISIRTCEGQVYTGNVLLSNDVDLYSESGAIRFAGLVDASEACAQSLRVHADAIFENNVGSITPLLSLLVEGSTTLGGSAREEVFITTCLDQTYLGATTLASHATLRSDDGLVSFAGPVDAAQACAQGLSVSGRSSFGADIGARQPLAYLRIFGTTMLGSGTLDQFTIATCGDQEYTDDLVLATDTRFVSSDGRVIFGGTLDASAPCAQSVTIQGNASFSDSVGASAALRELIVQGDTTLGSPSRERIDVVTCLDQRYNGATTLRSHGTLTSLEGGVVRFGGTLDGPHDLSVRTPGGLIIFGGNVGSITPLRDIALCTDALRTPTGGENTHADGARTHGIPRRATIIGEGGMSITTRDFSVCMGEKFTVLGDLTLHASRSATVGDVTTAGNMNISAETITLLRRPASDLFADDGSLIDDTGVDYVAGGAITMIGNVNLGGSDALPDPRFGSATGTFTGDGIARFDRVTMDPAQTSLDALVDDLMRVLDQRVPPRIIPPPPPPLPGQSLVDQRPRDPFLRDVVKPSVFDIDLLRAVAVAARPLSPLERILSKDGRYFYADIPGASSYDPGTLESAVTRFDIDSVRWVADQANIVFGAPGNDRSLDLMADLASSACRARIDCGGDAFDAQAYAHYVTTRPEEAATLRKLLDLRRLLDRLQALGLTPVEYVAARDRLLQRIAAPGVGLSVSELARVMELIGTPAAIMPTTSVASR